MSGEGRRFAPLHCQKSLILLSLIVVPDISEILHEKQDLPLIRPGNPLVIDRKGRESNSSESRRKASTSLFAQAVISSAGFDIGMNYANMLPLTRREPSGTIFLFCRQPQQASGFRAVVCG